MFKDKATLRLKAMDAMMKDKPSIAIKIAQKPEDGMPDEMQGEKGMVSMPVTMEEKAMIEAMRAAKEGEESAESPEQESAEPAGY